MNFKNLKSKIKEEQKQLAQKIRNGKSGRKPVNRKSENYDDWYGLEENQRQYRHKHIIYCNMFNNTPYDDIEQPRDENLPSSWLLDRIREKWEAELDEVIRDCA